MRTEAPIRRHCASDNYARIGHEAFAAMVTRLETAIRPLPEMAMVSPVESNAAFARIPERVVEAMHQQG